MCVNEIQMRSAKRTWSTCSRVWNNIGKAWVRTKREPLHPENTRTDVSRGDTTPLNTIAERFLFICLSDDTLLTYQSLSSQMPLVC